MALFNGKSNEGDLVTSTPVGSDLSESEPERDSGTAPKTRPSHKSNVSNFERAIENSPCASSRTSRKRAAETSVPAERPQVKHKKSRQAKVVTPAAIDKKSKGKGKEKEQEPERLQEEPLSPALDSLSATSTPSLTSNPTYFMPPIATTSSPPPLYSSSSPSTSSLFDGPEPGWNTDKDPLLAVMASDPTWQMDPDQLDRLAELELREAGPSSSMYSPPPSSPPQAFSPISPRSALSPQSSPLQQPGQVIMTPGVRARRSNQDGDRTLPKAGSSHSNFPPLEKIGGAPLIPGKMGRFKGSSRNRGGGTARRGQKVK